MTAQDDDQTTREDSDDQEQSSDETPELSEEGKEKVQRMTEAYDDSRETAVMPGTDNTITGVAVNEWLDDEGNPKFGKEKSQDDAESGGENDAESGGENDAEKS